jgi:hypothetical protein
VGIGAEIVAPPGAMGVAVLLHRAGVDRAPARVSVVGALGRWRGRRGASAVGPAPLGLAVAWAGIAAWTVATTCSSRARSGAGAGGGGGVGCAAAGFAACWRAS